MRVAKEQARSKFSANGRSVYNQTIKRSEKRKKYVIFLVKHFIEKYRITL
jgi:hypothetical protein